MQGCSNGLWDNRCSLLIHLSGIEADGAPTSQTLLDTRPKSSGDPGLRVIYSSLEVTHVISAPQSALATRSPQPQGGPGNADPCVPGRWRAALMTTTLGTIVRWRKKLFTVNLFKCWNVLPWAYIACTQTKGINVLLQELANIQGKHKLQVACRDQKRHQVRGWRDPCKRERSGKAQAL